MNDAQCAALCAAVIFATNQNVGFDKAAKQGWELVQAAYKARPGYEGGDVEFTGPRAMR